MTISVTVWCDSVGGLRYDIEKNVQCERITANYPEEEEPVEDISPKNMLILCGSIVGALAVLATLFLGLQMSTERRDIEKAKTDQTQARACESIEDESARTLCIMHVDD